MRITEQALDVKTILSVTKGASPPSHSVCHGRKSDAFVYILSGYAKYTFQNGETVRAAAGDVLFLAKDSVYRIEVAVEDYTYIFVDFLLVGGEEPLENELFHGRHLEKSEKLFFRAHALFHVGTLENMLYCKSTVYNIYADLLKSERQKYLPRGVRERLEGAVATISDAYADRALSVAKLAKDAGMSDVYFRRLFKIQYGSSPVAFIVAYRVSVAKQLLAATALPISDIAARCGFDTPYYFARVFRAHTGVTPLSFRKMYRTVE